MMQLIRISLVLIARMLIPSAAREENICRRDARVRTHPEPHDRYLHDNPELVFDSGTRSMVFACTFDRLTHPGQVRLRDREGDVGRILVPAGGASE